MTFKEFLLKEEMKQKALADKNKKVIEEWRESLLKLYTDIRNWLREADPNNIIRVNEKETELTESDLGKYQVPRLDLHIFDRWIGIIPKARSTVGTARPPQSGAPRRALGRVDITDEVRRFVLYRMKDDKQAADTWVIDDLQTEQQPLTREAFEKALMSYFQ